MQASSTPRVSSNYAYGSVQLNAAAYAHLGEPALVAVQVEPRSNAVLVHVRPVTVEAQWQPPYVVLHRFRPAVWRTDRYYTHRPRYHLAVQGAVNAVTGWSSALWRGHSPATALPLPLVLVLYSPGTVPVLVPVGQPPLMPAALAPYTPAAASVL